MTEEVIKSAMETLEENKDNIIEVSRSEFFDSKNNPKYIQTILGYWFNDYNLLNTRYVLRVLVDRELNIYESRILEINNDTVTDYLIL